MKATLKDIYGRSIGFANLLALFIKADISI